MKTVLMMIILGGGTAGIQAQSVNLPATQPTTAPSTRPATVQPYNAEKMLEGMLRAKPGTAKPLPPLAPEDDTKVSRKDVAPNAPSVALKREGDVIASRVGRVQPGSTAGQMEFAFESDGRTLQDPPMGLLPNKELARMEQAVKKSGLNLRFRVTGIVTVYHGKNYLLVEKADLVPDFNDL